MRGRALVILWSGVISFYPIKALILSRINFLILIDFLNSGFDSFFSNTTRFALAANSSEKIIEPIQSRCAMLRYSRLSNAQVLAKLLDVCDKENVNYTEDGLEAIVFTAQGDMRQALNNLQVKFNELFKFAIF